MQLGEAWCQQDVERLEIHSQMGGHLVVNSSWIPAFQAVHRHQTTKKRMASEFSIGMIFHKVFHFCEFHF